MLTTMLTGGDYSAIANDLDQIRISLDYPPRPRPAELTPFATLIKLAPVHDLCLGACSKRVPRYPLRKKKSM
ncbi:MAG: hypothetical protein E7K65_07625 [Pseudomonas sp.]|nr:hypothetical protein [Pseudomonas sp.]